MRPKVSPRFSWPNGQVKFGTCNPSRIMYVSPNLSPYVEPISNLLLHSQYTTGTIRGARASYVSRSKLRSQEYLFQGSLATICPCHLESFFAQTFTGRCNCLYIIRAVDRWHRCHNLSTDSSGYPP